MPITINNLPYITEYKANNTFVKKTGDTISCNTQNTVGLIIKSNSSQAVDTFRVTDSDDNVLFSINASGTVTQGTWKGNIISAKYGGTGIGTYDRGDLIYYNYGDTFSRLPIGPTEYVLVSTGTGPHWTNRLVLDEGLTVNYQSSVKFADLDGSNYIELKAPSVVSGNISYTLPTASGLSSGYFMQTNASGVLSWGPATAIISGNVSVSPLYVTSGLSLNSGLFFDGTNTAYIGIKSGGIVSEMIADNAIVSGKIASGTISQYQFASGSFFQILNAADNRVITSLASGLNQAYAETNLTYDGSKLEVTSQTLSGTAFSVTGVSGQIFRVVDSLIGDILVVNNISGSTIFSVNSDAYTKTLSGIYSGQNSNFDAFSIPETRGTSAFFDYQITNTINSGYRAGTVTVVWNGSTDACEYYETSTDDLGGSTIGLYFTASIVANNILLHANIDSGTWNIKIGARIL